jgi:hypothetical protein
VQNLHCRWTQIPDVSGQKLPDDFGQIKQSATVHIRYSNSLPVTIPRDVDFLEISNE